MNLEEYYHTSHSKFISKFTLKEITKRHKAIFLDRDGILIEDLNYIRSPDQVKLCKNVQEFFQLAKENKYHIVLVTNQSSVSRGIISYSEYIKITEKFLSFLPVDLYPENILTSFHLPDNELALDDFNWRKPGTGMFDYALKKYNLDPNRSAMIGDKLSDLIPANICKISKLIYIKSELHANESNKVNQWNLKEVNKIKLVDKLDFKKIIFENI